ncbi:helix-turn-helix domain-containing protein [Actinoplanes sp. NPDC049265]|uniref:helix-turn-helix domain-containing protein n=1 Tax=Actinoplanes sp. NPDC049265 TaxID=3363902 RepID=UPI00371D6513
MNSFPILPAQPTGEEVRRAADLLATLPTTPLTCAMAQVLETAATEMNDHTGPRPGWTAALALARAVLDDKLEMRLVLPHPMQETLEALADGAHAPDIAARYWVSENTVKDRLKRLYTLLGVNDRAEAVAVGFRIGVLSGSQPEPPFLHVTDVPLHELVAAREAKQIPAAEMAAVLGVSKTWLSRRERGEQPFPLPLLRRYVETVGGL